MPAKTCLLVEDSAAQAMAIMRMITGIGWTVFAAPSLRSALETLAVEPVDLALTDLVLPDSAGDETVGALVAAAPDCLIAAMTAGGGGAAAGDLLTAARVQGAAFLLRKPFGPDRLKEVFTEAQRRIEGAARREHVLIVDGSTTVRAICARTLEASGMRVTGAASLDEAIDTIDPLDLDAVLCDIHNSGADVIDTLPDLKSVLPGVAFLMMSGGHASADRDLRRALTMGADVALAKPFQPAELVAAVRKGIVLAKTSLMRRQVA